MTFTPTSVADFVLHFESNNLNGSSPFYYEPTTDTINFGYGINLSGAEDAALNGNSTLKNDIIEWL